MQAKESELRKAKEDLLAHAATVRREREKIEVEYESEEEKLKKILEAEERRYQAESRELKSKIAQLRLQEVPHGLANFRKGKDASFSSFMTASCGISYRPSTGNQIARFVEVSTATSGGLKAEQECVMCLSKERSVVLLPCAHQVLCRDCSEAHERQGMTDCPTCRTRIEKRIQARFAPG